jgi:hypothetical protein
VPDSLPVELRAVAAAFVALVVGLLVQTLRLSWRTSLPARRLEAARLRGAAGERRAVVLLEDRGFAIVGAQVAARYELLVDGERNAFDLRADFIVEKGSRRYVAEVKTGNYAPRLTTVATRRQLLEYGVAFDVDGVLLVDADSDTVRLVEVPPPSSRGQSRAAPMLIVALVLGGLAGAFVSARLGP